MKKKTLSREHRSSISDSAKDNPNYGMRGKKHSVKSREKMRLARLGKTNSNNRNNKISSTRKKLIKMGKIKITGCVINIGENHWNWKGGIAPLHKVMRAKSMWKIWREAVFLRDNFTCQNKNCEFCQNKIGVVLHPHHIIPVAVRKDLVFNIHNGITYCEDFHLKSGLHKNIQKGGINGRIRR
ncbi:hypothetical protein KAR91_07020 [Candidatus Pacearchaeota archaeon]|nr:hypothetical protein [Candidatus Pacearchaeota archaeon]